MAYSGSLVNNITTNNGKPARENWGTGVDPGHSVAEWGSDQGFPAMLPYAAPDVPTNVLDDYDLNGVHADPNMRAPEMEPKGHSGYGAPPRSDNRYDEIASDTKRHEANFGATLKGVYDRMLRSVSQTYASPRVPSLDPQQDDASASASGESRRALRGFNSLAMNNPGSAEVNFSGNYRRQGRELFRWQNRSMPRRQLTHDMRPVYLNLAQTALVTKPPTGPYSPNGSPFRSVASLNVGTALPMTRREPRPWDEASRTDGSESPEYGSEYVSWGM